MAISRLAFSSRFQMNLRNPIVHRVRKACPSSVPAIEVFDETEDVAKFKSSHRALPEMGSGDSKVNEWKKLSSKELGIRNSMISKATRKVLNNLKQKGYDVFLVGGCVRDLLLKRTPKDFDIITSAELREVRRSFSRCEIIGKRFPICLVHVDDTTVEVSSFSTSQCRSSDDSSHLSELPSGFDENDYGRWRNCLHRDFTINGFMFDPFTSIVYDYLGGTEDLKKAKVRTVISADISFKEDSARILRGIRIAARLGFRISKETAHFVKHFSGSLMRLGQGRLLMEVNYMLAYGSAEASLRILWKYGLLEILLPIQAAYFARTGFRRRDKRTNMLLSLLSNMDKLLAPDKPCHGSLWVAILAFQKALYDRPRDPSVVAAFGLTIYNGGDISKAIEIATGIDVPHNAGFTEMTEPRKMGYEELKNEVTGLAEGVKSALNSLTNERDVSKAMAQYSNAPFSDLVFIPLGLYLRAGRVFECVSHGQPCESKQGFEINYESLAKGSLEEVQHIFARIVFDTVYPLKLTDNKDRTG